MSSEKHWGLVSHAFLSPAFMLCELRSAHFSSSTLSFDSVTPEEREFEHLCGKF